MKNLVAGFCSNYSLDVVEPFLASWKASCRNSNLVLFTAHMRDDFSAAARDLGIILEDASPYLSLGFHPLCARFFMYRDYIARIGFDYDQIMLSDIRDVIFQADPFDVSRDADVYFAAEDQLIRDEKVWNGRWLRELYGEDLLREIEHNPVSCAGTTLGTAAAIQKYVSVMCSEMTNRSFDRSINYDQGIHNYIAWKMRPSWAKVDLSDSIYSTVIKTDPLQITLRDGEIYIEGKRPPVVHQWDRQPFLVSIIRESAYFRIKERSSPLEIGDNATLNTLEAYQMQDPNLVLPESPSSSNGFATLESAFSAFQHDSAAYALIYSSFANAVSQTEYLLRHREHVELNKLGFGDRAFYWQWKLLVDALPKTFSFLEIGVYKGQVLSLIGKLALRKNKLAHLFGVTPLNPAGDKFSAYETLEYAEAIDSIQQWAGVPPGRRAHLIDGLSTDDSVKRRARASAPYDAIYIDGGHDYNVVVNDIVTYGEMLSPLGYLIMDDASSELDMPQGIWRGHADVGRAAREILGPNAAFKECLAVGHLRTWQKISVS